MQRSHGGGAWRIFVQDQMRGRSFSSRGEFQALVQQLARQYRLMKTADPQAFALLKKRGVRAMVAHRNTPVEHQWPSADTAPHHASYLDGLLGKTFAPWAGNARAASKLRVRLVSVRTNVRELSESVLPRLCIDDQEAIDSVWRMEHCLMKTSGAPKLKKAPKQSACLSAGVCLHDCPSLPGLKTKFTATLRLRFPPKSQARADLQAGLIVLELKLRRSRGSCLEARHFAHVSYSHLRTFTFHFLLLDISNDPVEVAGCRVITIW